MVDACNSSVRAHLHYVTQHCDIRHMPINLISFSKKNCIRTPQDKITAQHIPPPSSLPGTSPPEHVLSVPNPLLKVIKSVICPISHGVHQLNMEVCTVGYIFHCSVFKCCT